MVYDSGRAWGIRLVTEAMASRNVADAEDEFLAAIGKGRGIR
ncbi:MAG TPA: hypothetical protein VI997_03495 [Candidatus Thermoplasmatota archaeon]|nr:hypothetical protein [Candidatus Thermoplasmatota archaeon]